MEGRIANGHLLAVAAFIAHRVFRRERQVRGKGLGSLREEPRLTIIGAVGLPRGTRGLAVAAIGVGVLQAAVVVDGVPNQTKGGGHFAVELGTGEVQDARREAFRVSKIHRVGVTSRDRLDVVLQFRSSPSCQQIINVHRINLLAAQG